MIYRSSVVYYTHFFWNLSHEVHRPSWISWHLPSVSFPLLHLPLFVFVFESPSSVSWIHQSWHFKVSFKKKKTEQWQTSACHSCQNFNKSFLMWRIWIFLTSLTVTQDFLQAVVLLLHAWVDPIYPEPANRMLALEKHGCMLFIPLINEWTGYIYVFFRDRKKKV